MNSYLLWLDEFELHATAGPRDEVRIAGVVEEGHQKLPELQWAAALIGGALTKHTAPFLLHLTWAQEKRLSIIHL